METTPAVNSRIRQHPPRLSPPPSSPLPINYNHSHHRNVQRRPNFTMPLTDLALRRITTTPYHFRFNHHHPKSFCLAFTNAGTMADKSTSNHISSEVVELNAVNIIKEEKEKATGKPTLVVPPPPPEKPLPGDCCGSGCVRCVWDVYYEELDEYDKLYKSDSKSS